ncbi:hypothetical protein PUN28_018664 [Cardiocondyla obscurior]|uniref:Uncharacterized protein n=1 Tax=Cardiocondyla obscurior TaxID=286306 RepID=A0AAW2EIU5_9HYME
MSTSNGGTKRTGRAGGRSKSFRYGHLSPASDSYRPSRRSQGSDQLGVTTTLPLRIVDVRETLDNVGSAVRIRAIAVEEQCKSDGPVFSESAILRGTERRRRPGRHQASAEHLIINVAL